MLSAVESRYSEGKAQRIGIRTRNFLPTLVTVGPFDHRGPVPQRYFFSSPVVEAVPVDLIPHGHDVPEAGQ